MRQQSSATRVYLIPQYLKSEKDSRGDNFGGLARHRRL